jgi:hypothetical protein
LRDVLMRAENCRLRDASDLYVRHDLSKKRILDYLPAVSPGLDAESPNPNRHVDRESWLSKSDHLSKNATGTIAYRDLGHPLHADLSEDEQRRNSVRSPWSPHHHAHERKVILHYVSN